jgi:hypothetical protein
MAEEINGKVQEPKPERIDVFRWQRWVDGQGQLWIVVCLFGLSNDMRRKTSVELLEVAQERTVDVTRDEFEGWVRKGILKRLEPL